MKNPKWGDCALLKGNTMGETVLLSKTYEDNSFLLDSLLKDNASGMHPPIPDENTAIQLLPL